MDRPHHTPAIIVIPGRSVTGDKINTDQVFYTRGSAPTTIKPQSLTTGFLKCECGMWGVKTARGIHQQHPPLPNVQNVLFADNIL